MYHRLPDTCILTKKENESKTQKTEDFGVIRKALGLQPYLKPSGITLSVLARDRHNDTILEHLVNHLSKLVVLVNIGLKNGQHLGVQILRKNSNNSNKSAYFILITYIFFCSFFFLINCCLKKLIGSRHRRFQISKI